MTDKKVPRKFLRRDAHKKKRIPQRWKKPRGIQNKMRLHRKSRPVVVTPGFGTKREDRNKTDKGLKIILVRNINELKKVDKKTEAVVLGRAGMKKKLELIKEAEKLGITLVNFNAERYSKDAEARKKQKEEVAKKRDEKATHKEQETKKAEKEAPKKDEKKEELTDEEKKKLEKEEKDKILTKKE